MRKEQNIQKKPRKTFPFARYFFLRIHNFSFRSLHGWYDNEQGNVVKLYLHPHHHLIFKRKKLYIVYLNLLSVLSFAICLQIISHMVRLVRVPSFFIQRKFSCVNDIDWGRTLNFFLLSRSRETFSSQFLYFLVLIDYKTLV